MSMVRNSTNELLLGDMAVADLEVSGTGRVQLSPAEKR